jgi:hypothetical protein
MGVGNRQSWDFEFHDQVGYVGSRPQFRQKLTISSVPKSSKYESGLHLAILNDLVNLFPVSD